MEPKFIIRACQEMKAACDDEMIHVVADAMMAAPSHYDRAVFLALYGSRVFTTKQRVEAYLAQDAIERLANDFREEERNAVRPHLGEVLDDWFCRQPEWMKVSVQVGLSLIFIGIFWGATVVGEVYFGVQ